MPTENTKESRQPCTSKALQEKKALALRKHVCHCRHDK